MRALASPPRCAQEPRLKPRDCAPRRLTRAQFEDRTRCVDLPRREPSQSTPIRPSTHRPPRLYPVPGRSAGGYWQALRRFDKSPRMSKTDGSTALSRSGRIRGRQRRPEDRLNGSAHRRGWVGATAAMGLAAFNGKQTVAEGNAGKGRCGHPRQSCCRQEACRRKDHTSQRCMAALPAALQPRSQPV